MIELKKYKFRFYKAEAGKRYKFTYKLKTTKTFSGYSERAIYDDVHEYCEKIGCDDFRKVIE